MLAHYSRISYSKRYREALPEVVISLNHRVVGALLQYFLLGDQSLPRRKPGKNAQLKNCAAWINTSGPYLTFPLEVPPITCPIRARTKRVSATFIQVLYFPFCAGKSTNLLTRESEAIRL